MTWLDIGNGWRNLYLLSCALQAVSLGTLFTLHRLFAKRSPAACFLTGVAATPLVQYLWTLLLALLWPAAPKLIYIGVPPALAVLGILVMALRRRRQLPLLWRKGVSLLRRLCHFNRPTLISLCFALCMVILLLPACVRFCSSMNSMQGGDVGEYMALAQRYCDDRSLPELLEKDETEGHFRGHSHFPSMELYMSYGLFHTGGTDYGYPNDKPAFTGLGLLTFYMAAAYLALLFVLCREKKSYILLGVLLLNLVPNLYDSVAASPRDLWRILGVLFSIMVFQGLRPLGKGGFRAYAGKLLLSLAVCFTVMSTHVVCFVVLPFVVAAWVIWRWAVALMRRDRSARRTLLGALGIALSGAAGTLLAYLGNLWCFAKWGEFSPWRLMTTYTSAPWYSRYMEIEYKLDETTTHLNFLTAKDDILLSYATPVGLWGFRLALLALICIVIWLIVRRVKLKKQESSLLIDRTDGSATSIHLAAREDGVLGVASRTLFAALVTLLTLAPMSGLLDTSLYSFSGSFLKLPRYTLQWFMMAAVMICTGLSAIHDLWPGLLMGQRLRRFLSKRDPQGSLRHVMQRIPLYLCALLCALSFVQGTKQTGYAASFYRDSRDVMENESLLLDNGYQQRYGFLTQAAAAVPEDQKILITRSGYQYPLKGRGYVLISNPIVPLLNLPLDEVGPELERLKVAMIATEPDFWDERYFSLTTLNQYLSKLPREQVLQTETMRLYLLDPALVPAVQEALAACTED